MHYYYYHHNYKLILLPVSLECPVSPIIFCISRSDSW